MTRVTLQSNSNQFRGVHGNADHQSSSLQLERHVILPDLFHRSMTKLGKSLESRCEGSGLWSLSAQGCWRSSNILKVSSITAPIQKKYISMPCENRDTHPGYPKRNSASAQLAMKYPQMLLKCAPCNCHVCNSPFRPWSLANKNAVLAFPDCRVSDGNGLERVIKILLCFHVDQQE